MIYFSFSHPSNRKEKRKDTNSLYAAFMRLLLNVVKKALPIANPDFEEAIQNVTTWYVEYDDTVYNHVLREIGQDAKNILVLRNAFEKTRKQMKVNALSINALSDNLNFQMFAKLTLKKT